MNKINLLRADCSVVLPDVVLVNETFCKSDISDAYLKLNGYNIISRQDGRDTIEGRCRGLLIYVKEGLSASKLELRGANRVIECSGIKIHLGGSNSRKGDELKIVLVYRPPTSPGSAADGGNTERLCELLRGLDGKVLVLGDFNLPGVDWERGWSNSVGESLILDTIHDKFWQQLIMEPTHKDGNILDLCITSSSEFLAGVEVTEPLGESDHNKLEVTIYGPSGKSASLEEIPDWTKADINGMATSLRDYDWEGEFRDKSGIECMDIFYDVVSKVTEKCVPKKLRRKNNRPMWMNKNIMRLVRRKRRLWRLYSSNAYYRGDYLGFRAYQDTQKELRKAVRLAKRNLERNLAKNAKKNPKKFFSYMKSKTSNKVSVGPLVGEDGIVTDDEEMARLLNLQYCNVFTREREDNMPEPEILYRGDDPLCDITFSSEDVRRKLGGLKPSTAPGPDGVWTRVLHSMADSLSGPLSVIYCKLFQEKSVPNVWLMANVCPIFKKGAKGDPSNYRPVSLTCVVCKVMESLIRDKMIEHLAANKLVRLSQHGFLSGRSTTTNLLVYLETLTKLLDEGHEVDVLYLDFAKAFDKVPHKRLLQKCKGVGLDGKLLEWIKVWLSGRKQRVVLNGSASEWSDVLSGVPQGSVLGPTLFLIYINDIDLAVDVTGSVILKFADDTKIAMVVETEEQKDEMQGAITRLMKWSDEWQMLFNLDKCHVMHLGRGNKEFSYFMGDNRLISVDQEKDLGVTLHKSLKPSIQCSKAALKANQVLGQISRSVTYRDKVTFLRLYKVFVRPHLEYAVTSWRPWSQGDKIVLEKVQQRALKMVTNLQSRTYEDRLYEAGLTTLEARRDRGDMVVMFRFMTGIDDVDPRLWFDVAGEAMGVRTRQGYGCFNVRQQHSRTEVRRNFFSQRVVSQWNNLPDTIKSVSTVDHFKNMYDEWVKF